MRHNKKRNSALLYEFLIRHISSCLVNDDKKGASKAVQISKRYFAKGTSLREELDLFRSILDTNLKSKHLAQRVLNEVMDSASKMNSRNLDAEKSKLIKEVNYNFGENLYKHKISNYTVYASICTLLNEERNKRKSLTSANKAKLEDTIVEHLIRDAAIPTEGIKVNPNYDNAVYSYVVKRFNDKYKDKLTENQKSLLTKYAVFLMSENKDTMKKAIQKEVATVKTKFISIGDTNLLKDKALMQKLRECHTRLNEINFDELDEGKIVELLQYIKLSEEVGS